MASSLRDSLSYTTRASCRVCGAAAFLDVLSLGELFVSNFIDAGLSGTRAPLELVLCARERGGCGLVQLRHSVDQDALYRAYWYRSGTNVSMRSELAAIARRAEEIAVPQRGDIVLDIGANDGTLLRSYRARGVIRAGFEPARNLRVDAEVGGASIISDFFNTRSFFARFPARRAKVVTAIAMFYDLEDPNAFVADLASVLAPDGLAIIQMSYLPLMLSQNAFDNICHEHLEYYALGSLEFLLARHGLEIFDVELNEVNGGSFRTYVRHRGARAPYTTDGHERVAALRIDEVLLALETPAPYLAFASRVERVRAELVSFLAREVAAGKQIYVYGASTKGNTLLQYFDLDTRLIRGAAERNQLKWGLRTVGTDIPIISEVEARSENPDYFLALPWHFMPEFLERERTFLERGGKFIVPLPEFRVVGLDEIRNTNIEIRNNIEIKMFQCPKHERRVLSV
ncbi:MAG: class I SAM-dependent methyltransferase [bacterium]|nr:class I SAM-dependent methyltransferase [bacterium]MDZ4284931.1 class I SAM-dependent methyltransferase [Patescibacteria group bacterium]